MTPSSMFNHHTDTWNAKFESFCDSWITPTYFVKHSNFKHLFLCDLVHAMFRTLVMWIAAAGAILSFIKIAKIFQSWIAFLFVSMVTFLSLWRRSDKCQHYKNVNKEFFSFSIHAKLNARVSLISSKFHYSRNFARIRANTSKIADFIMAFISRNFFPSFNYHGTNITFVKGAV